MKFKQSPRKGTSPNQELLMADPAMPNYQPLAQPSDSVSSSPTPEAALPPPPKAMRRKEYADFVLAQQNERKATKRHIDWWLAEGGGASKKTSGSLWEELKQKRDEKMAERDAKGKVNAKEYTEFWKEWREEEWLRRTYRLSLDGVGSRKRKCGANDEQDDEEADLPLRKKKHSRAAHKVANMSQENSHGYISDQEFKAESKYELEGHFDDEESLPRSREQTSDIVVCDSSYTIRNGCPYVENLNRRVKAETELRGPHLTVSGYTPRGVGKAEGLAGHKRKPRSIELFTRNGRKVKLEVGL